MGGQINNSIDRRWDAAGKHTPDIFGESTEDDVITGMDTNYCLVNIKYATTLTMMKGKRPIRFAPLASLVKSKDVM